MKNVSVNWVVSTLVLLVCSFQSLAAPCTATGSLSGFVFNDYNGDTNRGGVNIETGVADITVSVFSDDGTFNSCETTADGAFAIAPPSGGFPVRMEVTIPADKDYLFSGASGATRIQFFSAANSTIDIGLLNPKEYCDSDPMVATSCYINGNPELDEGNPNTASVADVLVGLVDGLGRACVQNILKNLFRLLPITLKREQDRNLLPHKREFLSRIH